jgi:hypothetical protein
VGGVADGDIAHPPTTDTEGAVEESWLDDQQYNVVHYRTQTDELYCTVTMRVPFQFRYNVLIMIDMIGNDNITYG